MRNARGLAENLASLQKMDSEAKELFILLQAQSVCNRSFSEQLKDALNGK